MLAVISSIGLFVDNREIMNESVWVKPLKFGVSFAAYLGTLAWLLSQLTRARRFGWWVGTVFAVICLLEVGVIALAAALGTYSHFNTSEDGINLVVQAVFKYGIPLMFLVNMIMALLVLVQRLGGRDVTATIRWGLLLSTLGMFAAFFIVSVGGQGDRIVEDASGNRIELNAGHGVGDLDGNGMFLTNWSVTGGDMRVSHFIGLHGIQILILATLALRALARSRTWLQDDRVRARILGFLAVGYLGVFATTAWQAVRGQSLVAPDMITVAAFVVSISVSAIGSAVTWRRGQRGALTPILAPGSSTSA